MLDARLGFDRPGFALDCAFHVADGERLVLVGESGSGKTTLLRLVAGLEKPARGHVKVDATTWFDGEAVARAWVPPHRRSIGFVPQDYALFPHLDVASNVAFGLRARGVDARTRARRVDQALERVGASAWRHRRPHELSGGQQQRVALARALVVEPRVLLLDEPLSALDARTRAAMRLELARALSGLSCATLYVTHQPVEALALGDRIAALDGGRIVQDGPPADLVRRPRSRYVADLLGLNVVRARPAAGQGAANGALVLVAEEGDYVVLAEDAAADEGDRWLAIDPRQVTLATSAPSGSARNILSGRIEEMLPEPPDGERLRVTLSTRPPIVAEVTRAAAAELGLAPGRAVWASFKATGVRVYD